MDKRVDIIYKSLPAYRLEFFDGLRSALAENDVTLRLFVGQPSGADISKNDSRTLPWAKNVPSRAWRVPGTHRQFLWHPLLRQTAESDLVIVEQAGKLLINYPLLLGSNLSGPPTALWGHGSNLQIHTASRVSESLKRRYSRLPHWWFAYTEGSRQRVEDLGYPPERITVVQN